jgi:hypothetical protein
MTIYSNQLVPVSSPINDGGTVEHAWIDFFTKVSCGILPYNYQVPVNGFSITFPDGAINLVIDPAGVLATGTIVMPPNPIDGMVVSMITSQTITAITISPNQGQSVVNAPASLTNSGLSFIFIQSQKKWYRKS